MTPRRALSCSKKWLPAAAALGIVLGTAAPAGAQRIDKTSQEGAVVGRSGGKSSKTSARIVMPTGHIEVAGEMAFLTSARSPLGTRLEFTDLALLRLDVRRSFADWFELYGGGELLAKQPTTTHAPLVQGGYLGAQAEFAPGFGARLGAAMGPMVGADGLYYQGGPGLSWKPIAGRYLRFVVAAGNSWTLLDFERSTSESFWLGEAVAGAETQIGDEDASMWVGIDYAVPFAKNPGRDAPDPERGFLDPQVRVNFEVGGAFSVGVDDWDVFAAYTIIDRGELSKPETTLPILDGGFDQQQLVVGVEYRFSPKRDASDDYDRGF